MTPRRLLPLLVLVAASCTSPPSATPTLPPTDTPLSTSTRTPRPSLTPTEGVSAELSEQLEAIHVGLFLVQVDAEVLTEAAIRAESGELASDDLVRVLAELDRYGSMVDQVAAAVVVPEDLAAAWDEASRAHGETQSILGRWRGEEAAPEDVIREMEPIRGMALHAMEAGEQAIAETLGIDAAEIEAARENALAEILELAFQPAPVVLGCGEGESEEPAAALRGRIAFVSDRDGDPEIYVANADGSEVIRLTDSPGGDYHPAWSPDGTRIAFYSERDGNAEIYVMGADGSDVTRLTNHSANDYDPAWSPDGQQIAFHSHRYQGAARIYVMNADGSGITRLTDPSFDDWSPDWSPDGTQIVFNSSRSDDRDIWVMNADGTGLRDLTGAGVGDDWWPDWSSEGTQIVFHSARDGNFEIYSMTAAGEALTRVTENPAGDYDPVWSPDGAQIAFTSDGAGNREVCVMNADGTGLFNVTGHPANDWGADWGR